MVLLKHDYGEPARGRSTDDRFFGDSLRRICPAVESVWIDEHDTPDRLEAEIHTISERFDPDLIFIALFRDQLSPDAVARLTERYRTAIWFGDDTWRFEELSVRFAPKCTFAITTDPFGSIRYQKIGVRAVESQWAAQPTGAIRAPVQDESEFEFDVSFVGGWSPYRQWFLRWLERNGGFRIARFGTGWSRNSRITESRMEEVFRTSRINLNVSNSSSKDLRFALSSLRSLNDAIRSPKTAEQLKARNFEIPLAGGFQLTNYVRGLERYFDVGSELAAYSGPEECLRQLDYFLSSSEGRISIAKAGHERAVRDHTFDTRMHRLLSELGAS